MRKIIISGIFLFLLIVAVLMTVPAISAALGGDIDKDGDVDLIDLSILLQDRNKSVAQSACGVACDLDQDGVITVLDARKLVLLCTLPRCEVVEQPIASY